MRVLHLSDRLSARGGADRHLVALLAAGRGEVETLLGAGFDDGSLPPAERARLGPWQRVKGLDRGGLKAKGARAARQGLQRLAALFEPDLIHLHNVLDPGLIREASGLAPALMSVQDHRVFCPGQGKLRPDGTGCRRVLGPHCLACFIEPDYGRRLLELTQERLAALKGLARVLVLSHYMDRELAAAGLAPESLAVLPPPVDRIGRRPGRGPGEYHLLAGRLVERKVVRVALAAAERLQSPLPLWVAGDGPMAGEVAQAAASSGGRLSYVGWADREQMDDLLAGARSLWLPSLWAEPFGIVGIEALAAGVPVVASRVGGVQDWLKAGENGLLVPPGDPAALAAAADRLARSPNMARAMGDRGSKQATREFAPGPLQERLLAIYKQVISQEMA